MFGNLIDDYAVECVMLDRVTAPDGEGGVIKQWIEGAKFTAAITRESSSQVRIAESQGFKNSYRITSQDNVTLDAGDVFKRVEDGKTFRVTSDSRDSKTPESSTLNINQVFAEEYPLS